MIRLDPPSLVDARRKRIDAAAGALSEDPMYKLVVGKTGVHWGAPVLRDKEMVLPVGAALFERAGLLFKNREDLIVRQVANLTHDAKRSDGTGDENFVLGGFARFARLGPAAV